MKLLFILIFLISLSFSSAIICNPNIANGCPEEVLADQIIEGANNTNFLEGHPASYFYPFSNPFNFVNTTTIYDYLINLFYTKSEVYNKTEIDSKIPTYQCTIRETADLMNLATPFDNWNSVAVSTGTFADAYAQPWYISHNSTFKDRNGVFAFRAHATNTYSGAYIRTGRKEILDDNSTYIVRANVLFANITGNSTMNGSNYLYTGQNVDGCIGQDRTTNCGSDTGKSGAWGLEFDGTNLRYYICTSDSSCRNQVLSSLVSLNLPANTWLVIEAKLNTSYGFYGNIWNQETGELLYTKSKPWGSTETPANLAAFPVGDFNKVHFSTIAINPFTTVSSPVFIDWTDLCIIGDEQENWGKIE